MFALEQDVSKVPAVARSTTATSPKHRRGDAREQGGLDDDGRQPGARRTRSRVATVQQPRFPQAVTDQDASGRPLHATPGGHTRAEIRLQCPAASGSAKTDQSQAVSRNTGSTRQPIRSHDRILNQISVEDPEEHHYRYVKKGSDEVF